MFCSSVVEDIDAFRRHVDAGHGARTALLALSAMTGDQRTLTFEQLTDEVAKVAGALVQSGVQTGDRVIIYMPMVAEAVFAMLACARIGAVHSVVFGGFAPAQLAQRIVDAQPAAILTASVGLEPGRVVEYIDLVASACEQDLARKSDAVPAAFVLHGVCAVTDCAKHETVTQAGTKSQINHNRL